MAMHFLHKSAHGRLVSLVVLFRLGAENPALAALLPKMPRGGQADKLLPARSVDPAQLLPRPRLLRLRRLAHGAAVHRGRAVDRHEGAAGTLCGTVARLGQLFPNNARPVQPLNGRAVTKVP